MMNLHGVSSFISRLRLQESPWRFVTSAGAELSVGTPILHLGINATAGALWLQQGPTAKPTRLTYAGVGGSAGVALIPSPGNFSFSIPDMPSFGVVYQLPFAGDALTLQELKGAFVLLTVAGDFGPGWGQSLIFLGGSAVVAAGVGAASRGLLALPALLATSNACVRFSGMSASAIPANLGACGYLGYLR